MSEQLLCVLAGSRKVELLAQAIDSVIMRVQVKLLNTTVRLEYMPGLDSRGIALELQIGKIIYSGEIGDGAGQVILAFHWSILMFPRIFIKILFLSLVRFYR